MFFFAAALLAREFLFLRVLFYFFINKRFRDEEAYHKTSMRWFFVLA